MLFPLKCRRDIQENENTQVKYEYLKIVMKYSSQVTVICFFPAMGDFVLLSVSLLTLMCQKLRETNNRK